MRVGILGCGYISQARHLPAMRQIDGISIEALCDLSEGTLNLVGDYYDVAKRYTSYADMLADDEIDAVAVLSFDHAPDVLAALRAGKHVLTEKPLAFTATEAEEIIATLDENPSLVLSVGYQKLHDPAVLWLSEHVAASEGLSRPRMLEIHDYGAPLTRTRGSFDPIFRVDDLKTDGTAAVRSYVGNSAEPDVHPSVRARIVEELTPDRSHFVQTYLHALMLGCHDLGVLTYVYGAPSRVLFANSTGPRSLQAVLEMDNGVPCTMDLQLGTNYGWWDERFSVYDDDEQIDLRFGNPFLAFSPTEITRRYTAGENTRGVANEAVGYEDGFKNEWVHFRDCVAGVATVRASAQLALTDIQTVTTIVNHLDPALRSGSE